MFEPQNPLEHSLMKAAAEPAHRAQFYRDFLEAKIFVLPVGDIPAIQNGAVAAEAKLTFQSIESNGKAYLPFFSSLPRLQAVISEERPFFEMGVRPLLELTRGANLLLNPGSDYGKEFLSEEVSQLLDGSMFQPSERHVVQKETQILIGQPAIYPTQLVGALQALYKKHPAVHAAFLAHYFDPSRDKVPGLLIAIESTGDWDIISSESGICAKGLTPDHDHVDFMALHGSGLESHFSKVKPFYKKSFFGGLFSK